MSIFNKFKKNKTQTNVDKVQINADSHPHQNLVWGQAQTNAGNISVNQRLNQHKSASLLIKQAWVTEKAVDLSGLRKYVFIVDRKANKPQIKRAIESIYKVKVDSINIVNVKGKMKRLGRSMGKTSTFKKVIVTLKEGEKIDIVPA